MEHTVSPLEAVVRPWRAATLLASALAAVELVVVVILAVALFTSGDEAGASANAQEAKPAAPKLLPRAKTRVLVLNGNGQAGAAAATAEQVKDFRYPIAAVGNADSSDYGRTVVLYRRGHRPEARRLAGDLGVRLTYPLDGMGKGTLQGAHLAVIVGN